MLMRKSKLPARTISLQSNTFFHMGAFILPFDGGIMNQFTCYFVKDTEFTGGKAKINCANLTFYLLHSSFCHFPLSAFLFIVLFNILMQTMKQIFFSAERLLQAVNDYKPAFYMAGPYHVQAISCMVKLHCCCLYI